MGEPLQTKGGRFLTDKSAFVLRGRPPSGNDGFGVGAGRQCPVGPTPIRNPRCPAASHAAGSQRYRSSVKESPLIGAASARGHSMSSHSSGRGVGRQSSRCAGRTRTAAKRELSLPRFCRHLRSHESAVGVCHGQTEAAGVHEGV